MDALLELAKTNGVEGLIAGAVVLVALYAMSRAGVVVTGDQKRIANVVLSALAAGVDLQGNTQEQAIVFALASITSALAYEGISYISNNLPSPKG